MDSRVPEVGLAPSVHFRASPKPGFDAETGHVEIDCPSRELVIFREP
jgi:hypothetical protein